MVSLTVLARCDAKSIVRWVPAVAVLMYRDQHLEMSQCVSHRLATPQSEFSWPDGAYQASTAMADDWGRITNKDGEVPHTSIRRGLPGAAQ